MRKQDGELAGSPEIITRGVVSRRVERGAARRLRCSCLTEFIGELGMEERTDPGLLREAIRVEVRRFFRKRTGRRPLVLPVVMEI